jgi:hypothetical protein
MGAQYFEESIFDKIEFANYRNDHTNWRVGAEVSAKIGNAVRFGIGFGTMSKDEIYKPIPYTYKNIAQIYNII